MVSWCLFRSRLVLCFCFDCRSEVVFPKSLFVFYLSCCPKIATNFCSQWSLPDGCGKYSQIRHLMANLAQNVSPSHFFFPVSTAVAQHNAGEKQLVSIWEEKTSGRARGRHLATLKTIGDIEHNQKLSFTWLLECQTLVASVHLIHFQHKAELVPVFALEEVLVCAAAVLGPCVSCSFSVVFGWICNSPPAKWAAGCMGQWLAQLTSLLLVWSQASPGVQMHSSVMNIFTVHSILLDIIFTIALGLGA